MSLDKHRNADGTYNGVTLMAEMTGLPVDEIGAIAEQVKANQTKLSACAYHEFERLITAPPGREVYGCKHCRGTVDAIRYRWHEQGRKAKPAEPAKPYSFTPVPGATCTQVLKDSGAASWPRTCQVHGLTCGVKQQN